MNAFPVMIFAAGFGTRMGELTQNQPKPLIRVAGKALIDHALDLIKAAPSTHNPIVANTHYLADQLHDHLEGVLISHEADEILETGGGLRKALPLLGSDTVITMNPDVIWHGPDPIHALIDAWRPDDMDALLLCVPIECTLGRIGGGDFTLDDQGRPSRGGNMVYGGLQIIKTEKLSEIPDTAFSLNKVWDLMAKENRLYCAKYDGTWCDVGRPDCIPLAEELIASDV